MKKETVSSREHWMPIEKERQAVKKESCEERMERSEISDEELLQLAINLMTLLIRCNFSENSASYIAERSGRRVHYIN